ncbi:MAG: hypothetical protein C5B51_11205 [Terriglobia bacterium]|nr:MAG: hypothetical protein C5B51_11205 [Terriglobia bacterium]
MKLYKSATHLNQWVAYSPETGWVAFPASQNGWTARRPARGLDPVHLREVPMRLAANTGIAAPVDGHLPHAA